MKKITRKSNQSNNQSNNNMEDKTMKKITRKSNQSNNQSNNNMEDKTMKKITRKSNQSNNQSNNNATNNNPALQAAQILAALDPSILAALGLSQKASEPKTLKPGKDPKNPLDFAKMKKILDSLPDGVWPIENEEKTSDTSEPKSQKADRTYEIPIIGADFVKSGIYAKPKSEDAGRYLAKMKALCSDVIDNLTAPIAIVDLEVIADKAEKNGGETLKNDLLQLAEKWEIPAQSMRIIMQLCAPVVGVCNAETDEIARRVYGMARANSLMGSACNTLMYAKAPDKDKALPFKRVAHNITALGLDFAECESVEECEFCDDDDDFSELVTLCDMWLKKCTLKNPAPEPKSAPRRAAKSAAPEPKSAPEKSEDKSAQILAALQALLNK